ncbi:MAG: hypothetical protein JJT90_06560 [Ectothiorhodospiraceae bacterium]|nr:hypothetical protein [Ectothiorhodospiraceae bacterium]
MAKIKLVDTTLRDGQQCLWATRMPRSMMLPVADRMDSIGFHAIELMGSVHFDACVRYLRENPWERIRKMKARMPRTPFQGFLRSACVLGFDLQPLDINKLWVEQLVNNGVERIVGFDGLHDFDNIAEALVHAKRCGARTVAWLIFSDSPVHTDALYVEKAKEIIERTDVDEILVQDTSGVLTPERAATLIPALRATIGKRPLGLHSHGLVGLPQRTYLEAAKHGVDMLYTCIAPIADGNAPPSLQQTIRNLRHAGHEVEVDEALIDEVSDHFTEAALLDDFPLGSPQDFDLAQFDHQMPGGALSNIVSQLDQAGMLDSVPEVLEECGRVREELGWPIQVTPFAQFIAVQATLNVIHGERYAVVPNEIKKYALGYFGKLLAPVDANVLDRVVERGSSEIALEPPAREPIIPQLRERYPNIGDDELILRYSFPQELLDPALQEVGQPLPKSAASKPLIKLVRELAFKRKSSRVSVTYGGMSIDVTRK